MSTAENPFDGLAACYQANRPEYPESLLRQLAERVERREGARKAADVGAGTGILTRALRRMLGPDWAIEGIEPGADMRRQAAESTPPEYAIIYREGGAESLPCGDGVLGLLTVAQAIQFFDRPVFYAETDRVLAAGGVLAVIQNNRVWEDSPLLDAHETFVEENAAGYSRHYRDIDLLGEFQALAWADSAELLSHDWPLDISADRFTGMMLSRRTMKPAVAACGEGFVETALRAMAARHGNPDGSVTIPYRTELYLAAKRVPPTE
ncbi:MAG: class I SAM-dependent methyltransferase [Alphaproteobacteria bacterium]